MPHYQIRANGVRRDTSKCEKIERSVHAIDHAAARETVVADHLPSINAEYYMIPELELSNAVDGDEVVGFYDMDGKRWLPADVPADDRPVFSGYSRNQLSLAFDKVRDPENWKMPIDKVLTGDFDQPLTSAAIAFFAGSEASFELTSEGVRVTAPGYYADIGS